LWIPLKEGIGGETEGEFTDNFNICPERCHDHHLWEQQVHFPMFHENGQAVTLDNALEVGGVPARWVGPLSVLLQAAMAQVGKCMCPCAHMCTQLLLPLFPLRTEFLKK